jgi:DNA-binding MarR family transcriptional regulator
METICVPWNLSGESHVPNASKEKVPPNPLHAHLGYWLRLVSNQVSGSFASALQERQLSVAEWVALNHVEMHPDITAASLADAMGMTRGAVSKVLDKLLTKNLLLRTPSPQDSRAQLLALTRSGKRLLPALTDIANGNDNHFFSVLAAGERSELRKLLQKLADAHPFSAAPVD